MWQCFISFQDLRNKVVLFALLFISLKHLPTLKFYLFLMNRYIPI